MKKTLIITLALLISISSMAAVLTGCSSESKAKDPDDIKKEALETVVPPEGFVLEGSWYDETSQRASMDITPTGKDDEYEILVSWGNGAAETITWQMSGTFDREGGFLYYDNCVKTVHRFDENDNEETRVEYENGEGAIKYFDGKLTWEDKQEDIGKDCKFASNEAPAE